MSKALVTGATGFLGQHMCARLHGLGWQVTGLGRNETEGARLRQQGIAFVKADLRDEQAIVRACAGQDAVFHCGALSTPWGAYSEFKAINVDGTRHIVKGCRKHEVTRLVHISTPSIYFNHQHDRLNVSEHDQLPAKPINAYAATKLQAEQVVLQAFAAGLPAIILRPRAIFGPLDRSLLPRLMGANEKRGIPLIGGGNAVVDLTYVDNVVDAMLLAWQAPQKALGAAYNITNGEPVLLGDVLRQLFAILDIPLRTRSIPAPVAYGLAALMEWSHTLLPSLGEPQLTRYSVTVLTRSQTLDIGLARKELGYTPQVSLHEGLHRFAQWWKASRQQTKGR